MHTPGSAAHHQAHHHALNSHHAAHHRAVDMHNAAHRAAVNHARWSADHGRAAYGGQFGAQVVPDARAGWTAQRGSHPGRGRTSGVIGLLRIVATLAIVAVLVGVALFVLKPTQPEWLAEIVRVIDGLFRMLRSAVS